LQNKESTEIFEAVIANIQNIACIDSKTFFYFLGDFELVKELVYSYASFQYLKKVFKCSYLNTTYMLKLWLEYAI